MANDSQQDFQQVNTLFQNEVIAGRTFDAIRDVYTEDARILPPGADMLTGLDHIRNFWEQAVQAMNVKSLKLTTVDLQVNGDSAVEIGTGEMETDLPTSPTAVKYVVIWRKEAAGWRWQTDIWNAAAESHQTSSPKASTTNA
jgi:ketosteroid isomerase-like protein